MAVAVHVEPDVQRRRVMKHGIVTVPGEMATLKAPNGMAIDDIPLQHRTLQMKLREVGELFVRRQRVRGLDFLDREDMHVYGPFPSYELRDAMLTPDQLNLPREEVRHLVRERDTSMKAFADYVLVGAFLAKPVLTEIWTPDKRLGGSGNGSRPNALSRTG